MQNTEVPKDITLERKIEIQKTDLEGWLANSYTWEVRARVTKRAGNDQVHSQALAQLEKSEKMVDAYKAELQALLEELAQRSNEKEDTQ